MQLSFAVRQDKELGITMFKVIKEHLQPYSYLNMFNISVLLMMTRIHRFDEQVTRFLTSGGD